MNAQKRVQENTRPTRLTKESEEYVAKREELRLAEIDSMKSRERVAQLRRQLPRCDCRGLCFHRGSGRSRCWRHTDPSRSFKRVVHRRQALACDLSLHVWKAANQPVSDVHTHHRQPQRSRTSPGAKCRCCHRRGGRSADAPRARAQTRLGQSPPPKHRRGQHL